MEHNTASIKLKSLVKAFIEERGLPFIVWSTPSGDDTVISTSHRRCRAIIWDSAPRKVYKTTKLHPCVTIYNINPKRTYTAIGDRRCELAVADPNFFEQLEYHLLHENEPKIV